MAPCGTGLSVIGVAESGKLQGVRSIRIAGSPHSLFDPERSNKMESKIIFQSPGSVCIKKGMC